jgi:tetratricopeptide (TPR) repeat protein
MRLAIARGVLMAVGILAATGAADAQRSRGGGCAIGPVKSASEFEDRVAACTITIDQGGNPQRVAIALLNRAQNLFNLKKCDQGIDDINRAKAMSPRKNADFYNMLIWESFYWQHCRGDFDRGIAAMDEAMQILPRDPAAYNQRSNLRRDKGDFAGAMADLNRSISLINNDPYRASAYNNRALLWKAMGEYERAIADFAVAIKLQPKRSKYYANRGEAYRWQGQLERALQDQNRSIEMFGDEPGIALARQIRGDTLRYMGEYERAHADYNAAISIEPDFAPAYLGRGLTFERQGNYEKAKADFQTALRVSERTGRGDNSKSARETAEARLAALASGVPQPTFAAAPPRVTSATSVPTVAVATPVVAPARVQATAAKAGRRVALVIGNSAYTSVSVLPNPQRDAEKVSATLRAIGFDTVTVAADATRDALMAGLKTFSAAAKSSDWAMVYYAGHGIEVAGVNYLVPVDAKLSSDRDVSQQAVALDHVMDAIDGARKLKLVVLDACRDNPFADLAPPPVAAAPAPQAIPVSASAVGSRSTTRSAGKGLGEIKVQGASLVVYAAKHGQTALDGDGENSPFAIAVVQRLATPGVEINKLFRLVRDDVMESTAGRQEPFMYGSLPGEDFFFVAK